MTLMLPTWTERQVTRCVLIDQHPSQSSTGEGGCCGSRHAGRIPIAHLDLYRLEHLDAEDPGLLTDYLTPDAIAFVEWPEHARWPTDPAVQVRLEHLGGDRRRITTLTTER